MIQKTDISVLNFDSCTVFVEAVGTIREGERDYGEQTLATPTLQRSHFLRGVVHMVLVKAIVQGVKSKLFSINVKSCSYVHQNHICAHQENHIFCISLFGKGQDRIYQK